MERTHDEFGNQVIIRVVIALNGDTLGTVPVERSNRGLIRDRKRANLT